VKLETKLWKAAVKKDQEDGTRESASRVDNLKAGRRREEAAEVANR